MNEQSRYTYWHSVLVAACGVFGTLDMVVAGRPESIGSNSSHFDAGPALLDRPFSFGPIFGAYYLLTTNSFKKTSN